jgi:hypothetical protein
VNNLPDFILKDVQDQWVRENFFRLQKFLQGVPFLKGEFVFFEKSFPAGAGGVIFPHGLLFRPTDIIQTAVSNNGIITWNYDKFTKTDLNVSVSGPCTVRAFVGAYREG